MSKLERLTVGLEQVLPLHFIGEEEPGTRVYEDLDIWQVKLRKGWFYQGPARAFLPSSRDRASWMHSFVER